MTRILITSATLLTACGPQAAEVNQQPDDIQVQETADSEAGQWTAAYASTESDAELGIVATGSWQDMDVVLDLDYVDADTSAALSLHVTDIARGDAGQDLQSFFATVDPALHADAVDYLETAELPVNADAQAFQATQLALLNHGDVLLGLQPDADAEGAAPPIWGAGAYAACWWACVAGGGGAVHCEDVCLRKYPY